MSIRLLLTAGALSLGLATGAIAQGVQIQPQPGMDDGQMDDGAAAQRPVKRANKKMKKPMKNKAMTRSQKRVNPDPEAEGADDGM